MRNRSQPFMAETDPNNPYGPNYMFLDRETKENYKFSSLGQYIQLTEADQATKLWYGGMLVGSLPVSCAWGYAVSYLLCSLLQPFEYRFPLLTSRRMVLTPLLCAGSMAAAYHYTSRMYHSEVVLSLTTKYLPEAVKNGFEDYPISNPD